MSSERKIKIPADQLARLEARNKNLYIRNLSLEKELADLKAKKNFWQKIIPFFKSITFKKI